MGKKQKTNGGDAVIYARYSSHNQRDVSIEQQVEACRKHAAELGLTVTATYEDRAISGKTDKRPSFQRMMRDAEQHKFAYVLAWKSNRIGRNMMQALVNESRLVDCGVKVFYAEEDFDDNAAGRFALRSMMNVNQFYIENMAEDVKRGLYDNAKKGLVNGSLPLGYKRGADGKPEIDEPKAAIVREIYTRVAAGELFASIADDLNARGIKTARGREWNKGSFHVLCHNDRYRGIYMYGDIRIPGGMPRIISDELFYDAQEAYSMKKDNRYGRARHGAENYLLTGKLYCGHCGGYMVGISGTSKTGEMHYYYACQKHRLEHTCEKKAIRRDVIENAVARAIMMYCLDDETIDFIVDSTIAYFKQKDHELHIEAMENELAAVQQAISNLMKAIEAGIITPTTRTRLLDLEEQQAKLSAKINTAKAERVEIDRDDLIAGLQLFRTGDIKNKKFLAKLFNTFLIAVYLYDDNRLKIVFSFTGNHNSVEIPLELDNDCPDSQIVSDETEVRMSHLECRIVVTNGLHGQRIGADDPSKAQLPPQTLGQHSVGERRRQAVLRCIGGGDVGGHYYVGPSCDSSRKRLQLRLPHLCPSLGAAGRAVVAVLCGISVAREMLECAEYARIVKPLYSGGHHLCRHCRIRRKCSVPDHGIGRIGVHICHWSKVKIQAIGFEVASDDLPHGTGIGWVPCCTYCLGTLVLGQIKAGSIGQPGHAAALLVHGGQQTGPGCCLKICQKLFQLLRAFHILPKHHNAAHRILFQPLPFCPGQPCAIRLSTGVQCLDPHHEQLPHLFPQRHGSKPFLYRVNLGCCRGRSRQQQSRRQQHSSCLPDDFSHERHLLFLSV